MVCRLINFFCNNDLKKYNCFDCKKPTLIFPENQYLCLSCNQRHYTNDEYKFCKKCDNPFYINDDEELLCSNCIISND